MTKKDYVTVAQTLGFIRDDRDRVAALEFFIGKAQADNPRFNANTFRVAVNTFRVAVTSERQA